MTWTASPAPAIQPARALNRLRGLTGKQAVVTLVVVLLLGLAGSTIELFVEWRSLRTEIRTSMEHTLSMVAGAATEAAYQLDVDLAEKVLEGVMEQETIEWVLLSDNFGNVLAHKRRKAPPHPLERLSLRLFGDVLDYGRDLTGDDARNGETYGTITVVLAPSRVAEGFFSRALVDVSLGAARALSICGLVVGIFYLMITRPILRLSQTVARIDPMKPAAVMLPVPRGHDKDELGTLVGTLNTLLSAFQHGLDQRDRAEAELTALTRSLEQRVAERTRELEFANQEISILNRRLSAENSRMGAELAVSRKIQTMILPTADELTGIRGLDVAAYMEPATEVGGDYYDILRVDDGIRIGIGDVTGHGLESGVVMLMTQTALRTLVTGRDASPKRLIEVLNRTLYDNIRRMGSDKCLTLALVDYRPGPDGEGHAGRIAVTGQHETVLVARADGPVEIIDTMNLGFPLGLVEDVAAYVETATLGLRPGDVVVLYSDGITEAADEGHVLYGMPRLCDVLAAHRHGTAADILTAIAADVQRHVGRQQVFDDLTLIVLKQT